MRKALMFTVFAVLLIGGATFAAADHGNSDKKGDCKSRYCKMFDKKDSNSDGVISKAEFTAHAEKKFAKMDTDGNGKLTKEEVKSYRAAKKEKYKAAKKEGYKKESRQCDGK